MHYWLLKTEPDAFSISDLAQAGVAPWDGIRNYQARNRLRDELSPGDAVLIYHSSCAQPAVVGLARVASAARPDPTQFDPNSPAHDPRSDKQNPRWYLVDIEYMETFPKPVTLKAIRQDPALENLELVKRSRLSVQKLDRQAFMALCQHGGASLHQ